LIFCFEISLLPDALIAGVSDEKPCPAKDKREMRRRTVRARLRQA